MLNDRIMILIDCPTCRRQVPERARTCLGCGKPLPREKVPWIRKHLLPNVVVLVLGASFVGWMVWMLIQLVYKGLTTFP